MAEGEILKQTTVKEGYARKRSGRMHQWSYRYFILSQHQLNTPGSNTTTGHEVASCFGCRLAYKLKADSISFKGSYDLLPGCVVTEVQSVGIGVGNSN